MSKKIIYLLSLLMALSLVFASCKKNAAGTGSDLGSLTPPTEEDNTDQANKDTGLFENWDDIPKTEVIKRTTVFKSGEDFYRNPVVVSMGDGRIFLFSEVRYKRDGAANDVGIDGGGVVDIVYKASKNSGITFDSLEKVVNKGNAITTTIAASHGAPNVFVLSDKKIVVVATAGGGIGRTAEKVGTGSKPASKVDYIVGDVSDTTITWGEWKEVTVNGTPIMDKIKDTIAGGPSSAKVYFNQYGTASGRGLVDNSTMVLSLVIANQGDTTDVYELMGRYVLTGTESSGTVTWTQLAAPVAYAADANKKLGDWKETQVFSGNSTAPNFIVVPSPWSGRTTMRLGKSFNGEQNIPSNTDIKASEGSAGSINLSGKWYGKNQYTINSGATGIAGNSSTEGLIMHVQDLSANLTMYVVDTASLTVKGTGFKINDVGKASSIDVLPDGTIITGAEEGGQAKNYYGVFTRYSQYYIADKTGNQ
ncbi:sialidase family protein [Brachyspira pilosicoli]|uniref:Sialidase (Neuraminidase) family protein-like protein n=1 Tax=Brachyspira pilosicoli (strain ATCC BAA-1826 / 95/1000) TaxID=759914 RepID=D8IFS8_BRAP9|nr:sialidase family protein [Brachyspira pilosicoli]ADK32001.1 sialidase (neuraminidase) family protein-like protein [Brachyspira pilosicoli 95/1000]